MICERNTWKIFRTKKMNGTTRFQGAPVDCHIMTPEVTVAQRKIKRLLLELEAEMIQALGILEFSV